VAELMTEDAETAGGIAKRRAVSAEGKLLDEVGAKGFILAMERRFGVEEEGGGLGFR